MTTSTTTAKKAIKKTAAKILKIFFVFLFWIAVWYCVALAVGKELILPAPQSVLKELFHLAATKDFWITSLYSLLSILKGFISGIICALVLAVLTSKFSAVEAVFLPVMHLVRATPVASFIILALLWLGKARVPALMSAIMVVPVVWGSVTTAIHETDKSLLELAKMYKFSKAKTLRYVYMPSVRPEFESALITSMGLAWKAGVAAEVLSLSQPSIGAELYYSKIYLETASLFAWTAVVIIFSFLLEKCFVLILLRKNRRQRNDKY